MNKIDASVMLIKKKEFNIPIAIVGFLFGILGLVVYAIVYSMQSDEVEEIVVVGGS